MAVALCGMIPLYLWPEAVVYLFAGDNAALLPVATLGIWLYFWGLPMEGLLLVGATYFQAINRARIASLLTGGKLVLIGGFLWGFSALWGVAGVWLALGHVASAIACFVTIIGIPFGIQHLKLAGIALAPIGKTIVPKEVAQAARQRNAEATVRELRKEG